MTRTNQEVNGAESGLIFSWFPPIPPDLIYQYPIKRNDIEMLKLFIRLST